MLPAQAAAIRLRQNALCFEGLECCCAQLGVGAAPVQGAAVEALCALWEMGLLQNALCFWRGRLCRVPLSAAVKVLPQCAVFWEP